MVLAKGTIKYIYKILNHSSFKEPNILRAEIFGISKFLIFNVGVKKRLIFSLDQVQKIFKKTLPT